MSHLLGGFVLWLPAFALAGVVVAGVIDLVDGVRRRWQR